MAEDTTWLQGRRPANGESTPDGARAPLFPGEGAVALSQELTVPPVTTGEEGPQDIDLWRRFFNVRTLISFIIAALTLYAVARAWGVDLQSVLQAVQHLNVPLYFCAFGVYALTFPVRGFRWRRLLRNIGLDAKVRVLSVTIFLSWFVNCVAPAKLGDLYRAYLMRRNEKLPLTSTLGTIFAERIIDSVALFVILLVGLVLSASEMTGGKQGVIVIVAGAFIVVLFLALLIMRWQGARLIRIFPARVHAVYHRFVNGAFASFKVRYLPQIAVLTFLAWGCEFGRLFIVTRALGLSVSPPAVMVVLSGASLLLTVPTPGGLGAVEAGLASLLVLFGVNKDLALAVAVLDRVVSYWALIAGGLPTYIFSKRTR
ncbi:MAG: flippase-like domain-containing protein [Chloroflexi bacterium]|nr:flippase-like domain-containing protein [Chloroflexota bacterium]